MTVAQAVPAAGALGKYLDGFRASVRALGADMDDPATFERVMSDRFGRANSLDPFPNTEARGPAVPPGRPRADRRAGAGRQQPRLLTLTPILPGVAPYPRLRVDPATGQLYLNDASRSPKWFGPHTPAAGARVRGTFPAENDRFDLYEAFVAGGAAERREAG